MIKSYKIILFASLAILLLVVAFYGYSYHNVVKSCTKDSENYKSTLTRVMKSQLESHLIEAGEYDHQMKTLETETKNMYNVCISGYPPFQSMK